MTVRSNVASSSTPAIFTEAEDLQGLALQALARYGTAVHGVNQSRPLGKAAVHGQSTGTTGNSSGVWGTAESESGAGVYGNATGNLASGVRGVALGESGAGVSGESSILSPTGTGVRGTAFHAGAWGVFAEGRLGASGTKSFVQPHPKDPSRNIQFICLEGNESGTYFRGSTLLVNGVAEIPIPEEWTLVTEADGITVQVTPTSGPALLHVPEKTRHRIVVRGAPDCAFDYFVNGIRRGFQRYEPFVENHAFRPRVKRVPFGTQFPRELRNLLIESGILNPDFTPNEETAARLGWQLQEPDTVPAAERWWLPAPAQEQLPPQADHRDPKKAGSPRAGS